MTVLVEQTALEDAPDKVAETVAHDDNEDICLDMPEWVEEMRDNWGEPLFVQEWEDKDNFRGKNGWQGRDYIHDKHAPVRILEYFAKYGTGEGLQSSLTRGGVRTTLTGIAHFTKRAESHKGYCHGGTMCSLMDDIIGWCAFLTTGSCKPWTGFTVQVNTSLKKPIPVNSYLLLQATITKIERRKVSVTAELLDPAEKHTNLHATGEGLVVLNRGVLPDESKSRQTFS